MAEIRHRENRHEVIFFCRGWSDLDKILQTDAELHIDCGDMVRIGTICYGGHFGEFNGCHPRLRAMYHIAGCKNSIRHIENRFSPYFILFCFLMQFGL